MNDEEERNNAIVTDKQEKFKSCKNCPDRTVEPNCHTICEGYIERQKKQEELHLKLKQEKAADQFLYQHVSNHQAAFSGRERWKRTNK